MATTPKGWVSPAPLISLYFISAKATLEEMELRDNGTPILSLSFWTSFPIVLIIFFPAEAQLNSDDLLILDLY